MTSRREEKERRRAERVAAEEEAARAQARRRRLGIVAATVLGLAAVAAVGIALTRGGDEDERARTGARPVPKVAIPPARTTDLRAAARAAGCQLRTFTPGPNDAQHVQGPVRYRQEPPVFGPHHEIPAHDGNYVGQGSPATEALVHSLEHGRVIIWYRPAIGNRRIGQLQTLFDEPFAGQPSRYKQILVERPRMPFAVAATSWGQQLTCRAFNDAAFDALRTFRAAYVGKAPEGDVPWPA